MVVIKEKEIEAEEREQTTFWISSHTIREFKKRCIDEGVQYSEKAEQLIKEYLKTKSGAKR